MSKIAVVTGITGQDGSYLAELLSAKGYEVHGVVRRSSSFNTQRLGALESEGQRTAGGVFQGTLNLHYGDVTDSSFIDRLVNQLQPDEYYNLAAQSHVRVSFDNPLYTSHATGTSSIIALEAIRNYSPSTRFYQASSSEMFGSTLPPQNEASAFHPRSPYGVSKVFSYWASVNYRESFGIHASNGILFNHESPRRGENFVTRKIAKAAAAISLGLQEKVELGNLDARRDWGYAPEYVGAMWLMLQQEQPDDFVVATGSAISVRDFAEMCFKHVGLEFQDHVIYNPRLERPAEVDALVGDSSKARLALQWQPTVEVSQLAQLMVEHELKAQSSNRFEVDQVISWGM
jgi:GDPmannose 4,6-dehydratase